jgi:hypothetical protein
MVLCRNKSIDSLLGEIVHISELGWDESIGLEEISL